MKKSFFLPAVFSIASIMLGLTACSSDSDSSSTAPGAPAEDPESSESTKVVIPVDYSAGRAMNKKLGKGINIGNAWESKSYGDNVPDEPYNYGYSDWLDAAWGNAIDDGDFAFLKDAGFNSIRLPVRWQHNSNPVTHEVNPPRLAGVLEDIQLAMDAGLPVVISFHWYQEIMDAANNADKDPAGYEAEKAHFAAIWKQVATELDKFPDDMIVFDILNEPTMSNAERLNDVMMTGYEAIRSVSKKKTIMFESFHAAKFYDIDKLTLPEDGNIIYSGHYYEPFQFTHEGLGYKCVGDDSYANAAAEDFKRYAAQIKSLYPDVNGTDYVPVNLGEFGVAGQSSSCHQTGPTDRSRIIWVRRTIAAAEAQGFSWHYWDYTKASGFEAFSRSSGWYPGFPEVFFQE